MLRFIASVSSEHDAQTTSMGSNIEELVGGPDLINRDLLAGFLLPILDLDVIAQGFWLQQTEIGMVALMNKPVAGQAFPHARPSVCGDSQNRLAANERASSNFPPFLTDQHQQCGRRSRRPCIPDQTFYEERYNVH